MLTWSWLRRWASLMVVATLALVGLTPARASAQTVAPEISELARALKYDPDLIYEYVYNNIETIPIYGSLKGPLGAMIDGRGTAFDQAELMVLLLQQAAANNPAVTNPQFQIGTVWLSQSEVSNWTGVDNSLAGIGALLSEGGIPSAYIVPGTDPTKYDCVAIKTAWVQVTINGTSYAFDPASKLSNQSVSNPGAQAGACTSHGAQPTAVGYNNVAGVNLATAIGYTQSAFVTDAESGMTSTFNSITGLNRTNIRNDLTTYSKNLVAWIRANKPAASTADIVGGRTIASLPIGTHQRWQALPYLCSQTVSSACSTVTSSTTLDPSYRTTLTLTFPNASPIVFNSSDIYGHRLSFNIWTGGSGYTPGICLYLDGSGCKLTPPINTSTWPVNISIGVQVTSPAAVLSSTSTLSVTSPTAAGKNAWFVVANGWGGVSRTMIERHRKALLQYQQANPTDTTSEPAPAGGLEVLANTWMAEVSQASDLIGKVAGVKAILPYSIGIAGFQTNSSGNQAAYVDLPVNVVGQTQLTARPSGGVTPVESLAFIAQAGMGSALEAGAIEQTQTNDDAVSTVKLLDVVATGTIYDINNAAIPGDTASYWTNTLGGQLSGYSASDASRINSAVTVSNLRVIAASQNPYYPPWNGYFLISQAGSQIGAIPGATFNAVITGGLSGGYSTSYLAPAQSDTNFGTLQTPTINDPSPGNSVASPIAGVDTSSGAFANDHTDLSLGSGRTTYGFTFSRHYNSSSQFAPTGPLGLGWTHNMMMYAAPGSDGFAGMGAYSPISGASAVATLYVLQDILKQASGAPEPLDRLMIGVVSEKWLIEQLENNVVNVVAPNGGEFVKLADGSYNTPLHSNAILQSPTGYLVQPDGTRYSFSGPAGLVNLINPVNDQVLYQFNYSFCGLSTINIGQYSSNPVTISFNYTNPCLLTSVTDGTRTIQYSYDANKNLISYRDAVGNNTTYSYDQPGRLTQIYRPSFPSSAFATNIYNVIGQVTSQQDVNGKTTTIYSAGSRAETDNPVAAQNIVYFTLAGDVRAQFDALGNQTLYTYDGLDRLVTTTFPEGNSVTNAYDNAHGSAALQNVLSVTASPKPSSGAPTLVTSYTYDLNFQKVASVTDPKGNVTHYVYDDAGGTGNLTEIDQPAVNGQVPKTLFWYANGLVIEKSDPIGMVTNYSYKYDIPTTITESFGNLYLTTQRGVDSVGNITSVTDPKGNVTSYQYDAERRITKITGPTSIGNVTQYTYNPDGLVTQIQRATGNAGAPWETASATYSPALQMLTKTDGNGNTTTYAYDTVGRLSSVTDPVNRVTSYGYDLLNRVVSKSNTAIQAAPLESYTYTVNGKRKTLKDGNGNVSTWVYDGQDRLASLQYPSKTRGAGTSNAADVESYTYDADGNVLTFTRRDGTVITSAYDPLNRLISKKFPGDVNDVYYAYDLTGRLLSAQYGSVGGTGVVYAYDTAGRLTSETTNGKAMSFAYDVNSNRIQETWPDGFYVNYAYDAANRVTSIAANGATTTPGLLMTYTYDPLGRRLNAAFGNSLSTTYAYDAGDRLTALNHLWPAGNPLETLAFNYTAANQILMRTGSSNAFDPPALPANSNTTINSTADGLNRDAAIAALGDGYDNRGNVTDDGTRKFSYDILNHLTGVNIASTSTVAALAYDPTGRLQQYQVTVGAGSPTTTQFLYEGSRLVAELDGAGAVLRRYVHGPGTDTPVVWYEGAGAADPRWLNADERGSIIFHSTLTYSQRVYTYGPWGEPGAWGGSRFSYTGQIQLPEVQLYHYKARVYDPAIGRFLQTDPVGYNDGVNIYAYGHGDPVNGRDPSGTVQEVVVTAPSSTLFSQMFGSYGYYPDEFVDGGPSYADMPSGYINFADSESALSTFEARIKVVGWEKYKQDTKNIAADRKYGDSTWGELFKQLQGIYEPNIVAPVTVTAENSPPPRFPQPNPLTNTQAYTGTPNNPPDWGAPPPSSGGEPEAVPQGAMQQFLWGLRGFLELFGQFGPDVVLPLPNIIIHPPTCAGKSCSA